jgi:hypothetical protein
MAKEADVVEDKGHLQFNERVIVKIKSMNGDKLLMSMWDM